MLDVNTIAVRLSKGRTGRLDLLSDGRFLLDRDYFCGCRGRVSDQARP
jgi:hypothetical protein